MFVHLGFLHAFTNVSLTCLTVWWFRKSLGTATILLLGGGCFLLTGPVIWFSAPALTWYAGLSGPLHGLVYAASLISTALGHKVNVGLLALVTIKLSWEFRMGALPGSESLTGGPVAVEAHIAGAAAALALVPFCMAVRAWRGTV